MAATADVHDEPVGYLTMNVLANAVCRDAGPIYVVANEMFYLGRSPALWRAWSDPTISNRHLRIHCILYEKGFESHIPPLVYVTDVSVNGTSIKKKDPNYANSHVLSGVLMSLGNNSYLLEDGDELGLSKSVILTYHNNMNVAKHPLTDTQQKECSTFAADYHVTGRILGKGASGKVFIAVHRKTCRQLACKVVDLQGQLHNHTPLGPPAPDTKYGNPVASSQNKLGWPTNVTRCFREFDVLGTLDHPNIIFINKVFWSTNTIFIFEDLITAGDLFSYIEFKGGRLTDIEAAVLIRQILRGVEYLHHHDIVHRDLKPDNILMTSLETGARIVITDFGHARYLPHNRKSDALSTTKRRMYSLVGTLGYAAPEIHNVSLTEPFNAGYSKAIDMWSIGCIATVLLSGEDLFTDPYDVQGRLTPEAIISELSHKCAVKAGEGAQDNVWPYIGTWPKDFVQRLLVLRPNDRMNVTEALCHNWFGRGKNSAEFEALYQRSVKDWRPRRKIPELIQRIPSRPQNNDAAVRDSENHIKLPRTLGFDLPQSCYPKPDTVQPGSLPKPCHTYKSQEAITNMNINTVHQSFMDEEWQVTPEDQSYSDELPSYVTPAVSGILLRHKDSPNLPIRQADANEVSGNTMVFAKPTCNLKNPEEFQTVAHVNSSTETDIIYETPPTGLRIGNDRPE